MAAAIHRGGGKSYLGSTLAIETAIKLNQAFHVAPTIKQGRGIVTPLLETIKEDAPRGFRFRPGKDDTWEVGPGRIQLAGSERGSSDTLRGRDIPLAVLDECGFFSDLPYLMSSVLMPRVLPVGGKIFLISTPPPTPSHPFAEIMRERERAGRLFRLTVDNNPFLSSELKEAYAREAGGVHTTAYRREYLCEVVIDAHRAVIPELVDSPLPFGEAKGTWPIGVWHVDPTGLTVLALADLDPDRRSVHFLQEWVGTNTSMAGFLETVAPELRERVASHALPLLMAENSPYIEEARLGHQVFPMSVKEKPESRLGTLRSNIKQGRLSASPECLYIRRHLHDAIWNEGKTKFDESGDGGHFEGVDAASLVALPNLFDRFCSSMSGWD